MVFTLTLPASCSVLHWYDMTNHRGRYLQEEVLKCVRNRK